RVVLANLLIPLGEYQEAKQQFLEAIKCTPDDASLYVQLGDSIYVQLGGSNSEIEREAEDAYRKAIQLHEKCAEAHYGLGRLLKDQNRWPEAEEEFKAAIHANPNYVNALQQLGLLLQRQNRREEADIFFAKAGAIGAIGKTSM